ncbi:hypothetical protein QQS21_011869 [Conoideocrella luteorostrata]|uniref:Xylanolytic transcriptional activator regulatory domain-containing protein n=1 Tax=Conoideocrella luteorostrata TaxID=1105319 RepID=A0AAJ0CF11_9HYPO|nr:hypothetical protein QQS21_011869 [Conoideocrella luteorostrata]
MDREYRHPRTRADKSNKSGSGNATKPRRSVVNVSSVPQQRLADNWEGLPPTEDLIDGVNLFTKQYFQLGFIPKEQYPERLRKNLHSTSLFLLMSILSISARLSPAFKFRYGNGVKAAEYFMERASSIANEEIYQEPTLERCQAFYLLSIAQQGSGERSKSYINMGIAMRMAILMHLHREETYHVPNPTPELIIRAESARRTIWMLHSQDNLHSGPQSPVSLCAGDITTMLPCNEEDFAHGREPRSRAALDGTPPAMDNPKLIRDPGRSLFATLMQVHDWWGLVGRRAVRYSKSPKPWDTESEFSKTARKLREWEQDLPHEHGWSPFLFKGYKADGQELAYLCVTMMTRLSNIVLRRPYLIDIIKPDRRDTTKQAFFKAMSNEIFVNVRCLYEQIDVQFTNRSPNESVVCQDQSLAGDGPIMLQRTIGILNECRQVWPLAARWVDALEKFSLDPQSATLCHEGSMDDGKDPIPRAIRQLPPLFPSTKQTQSPAAPPPSHPPPPPPPTLPEPNVLPRPGMQPELPPASSIESPRHQNITMNPVAGSAIVNGTHHLHSPPQQQLQPPPPPQPLLHQQPSQPQQYQPPPPAPLPPTMSPQAYPNHHPQVHTGQATAHNMYIPPQPPNPMGRQNVDGLGMLIEAFDSPQPPVGPHAANYSAGPYNPQLGPGTDGFEGELQFYIDGPATSWINSAPWLDTIQ